MGERALDPFMPVVDRKQVKDCLEQLKIAGTGIINASFVGANSLTAAGDTNDFCVAAA